MACLTAAIETFKVEIKLEHKATENSRSKASWGGLTHCSSALYVIPQNYWKARRGAKVKPFPYMDLSEHAGEKKTTTVLLHLCCYISPQSSAEVCIFTTFPPTAWVTVSLQKNMNYKSTRVWDKSKARPLCARGAAGERVCRWQHCASPHVGVYQSVWPLHNYSDGCVWIQWLS